MITSDKGVQFIGSFEGYRRWPYNDAAGYATVGYGHLLHYSNVNAKDLLRYHTGLSVPAALKLLRKDCLVAERAVRQSVHTNLKQGAFDALVSFTFNCGAGALSSSRLLKLVNDHKYHSADITSAFVAWDHAGGVELPGLKRRRLAEANLFLTGKYGQGV